MFDVRRSRFGVWGVVDLVGEFVFIDEGFDCEIGLDDQGVIVFVFGFDEVGNDAAGVECGGVVFEVVYSYGCKGLEGVFFGKVHYCLSDLNQFFFPGFA